MERFASKLRSVIFTSAGRFATLFLEALHTPPTIRGGPWLSAAVDLAARRQLALVTHPNGRRHIQDDDAEHHTGEDPGGLGYALDYGGGHHSVIR